MYLLDTSVLLEFFLNQERADEAERLLQNLSRAGVSDFTLFSMGIILLRRGLPDVFLEAHEDFFVRKSYKLLHLRTEDIPAVIEAARKFGLDFDDAYQYTAAEKFDLTIVSLDDDFDRTERGRKTPAEVLEEREASG